MENRKVSKVRALREKFEVQADENRSPLPLTKSASQTKLVSQFSSLNLDDSISLYQEGSPPFTPSTTQRLSVQVPIPPSVLPVQVLKPRPRPFSYSEATGSELSKQDVLNSCAPSPPEKPPRTFLYDLLSDPSPEPASSDYQPSDHKEVLLRRKPPLVATQSLPKSVNSDLGSEIQEEDRRQSVPSHRKAIYISYPSAIESSSRHGKNKPSHSSVPLTTNDDCNSNAGSRINGNGIYETPNPHVLLNVSWEKYLSATKEMTRIRNNQHQGVHRISTANIRPISVSVGTSADALQENQINSPTEVQPSPPPRLHRARTESDMKSYMRESSRGPLAPVRNSPDRIPVMRRVRVGQDGGFGVTRRPQMIYSSRPSGFSNSLLNSYYYPRGITQGPDGIINRQPLPSDHPNHQCAGMLQNFQQFFDCDDTAENHYDSRPPTEKYLNFIRKYHPELEEYDQPALFYRQGTSVTVVPPTHHQCFKSVSCSTYQPQNCQSYSFVSPELGMGKKSHDIRPSSLLPLPAACKGVVGKSKSDWNLNNTEWNFTHSDQTNKPHPTDLPVPTPKLATSIQKLNQNNEHYHHLPCRKNSHRNGIRPSKPIQQSIHSLVNQVYPVSVDEGVSGKNATSSTDSGIQLGTDSLSSCETPVTGDSTTDTGDSDCENETETLEATRQVVEERKGYIRRVSSIRATELLPLQRILHNHPLPPLLPDHGEERGAGAIFDNLLVIGIRRDEKTGAYHPIIKYKFPPSAALPDGIERFCFPDSLEWPCHEGSSAQFYTLTITQSDGSRKYGCCYRILPDGANICIPIAYCIISQTRAIGFYRNVLQTLASRHGYSDSQMSFMINELYEESLPDPGKNLIIQDPISFLPTDSIDYGMAVPLVIRRKADFRLENTDLYVLLSLLDLSTVLKLFGSLLLERKIVILSKHLNSLSLCVEALESALYPFSWQHTFVPILPLNMNEILEVPAPFLVGVLQSQCKVAPWDLKLDEGIVVDLDQRKILSAVGDEGSILPKRLYKKLREALASVLNLADQTEYTKNVLISECFIRMFVETLGHYRACGFFQYSLYGIPDEYGTSREKRTFKKELFLKAVSSKSNRDFLDWFTETSMFHQFLESRKKPDFKPGLFEQRCMEQLESNKDTNLYGQLGSAAPWKNQSILSKGTAWLKETFTKERE